MVNEKSAIRRQIQQIKKSYAQDWLLNKSQALCNNIINWSVFDKATNIFAYLAMPDEINLDFVIKTAINQGKNVFVPHIISKEERQMQAVLLEDVTLVQIGEHNIRTAILTEKSICPKQIDLALVPGLGFSKTGVRLGVGGGYYDRFLSKADRAVFAGVVLKKQIFNNLPYQNHDVFMNYIISEFEVLKCLKTKK